jgi:hypothetical protein
VKKLEQQMENTQHINIIKGTMKNQAERASMAE